MISYEFIYNYIIDSMSKGKPDSNFEALLEGHSGKMPSIIHGQANNDSSLFFQNSHSFVLAGLEDQQQITPVADEFVDDDDPGFDLYEVEEKDFTKVCKKLAEKFNFPLRSCAPEKKKCKLQKLIKI